MLALSNITIYKYTNSKRKGQKGACYDTFKLLMIQENYSKQEIYRKEKACTEIVKIEKKRLQFVHHTCRCTS